jgi:hypothetical protein
MFAKLENLTSWLGHGTGLDADLVIKAKNPLAFQARDELAIYTNISKGWTAMRRALNCI